MPPPLFHPFPRLVMCTAGLIFASAMVQGAIVGAAYVAALLTRQPPQEQLAHLLEDGSTLAAMLGLTTLTTLPWIWFCRRALDRRSLVSLGLRARRSLRDMGGGLLAGAATIAFLFTVLLLSGHVAIRGWLSPEAFDISVGARFGFLLLWFVVFCIVGFGEELLFRGYGLHNLAAWMGVRGAVVYQAIIFALIHLGYVSMLYRPDAISANNTTEISAAWRDAYQAMPNIALVGIFFALCYLKTGSLWFPIGFHIAWNFCLGCLFSLPVSGLPVFRLVDVGASQNHLMTGGSFGLEGSVLLIPILLTLIYLMARQPDHPQAKLDLALLDKEPSTAAADVVLAPVPTQAALTAAAAEETEEESHESRFKTTFRSTPDKVLRTDEGDSWQDLTKPIPTVAPAPRPPQTVSTPIASAPVINVPPVEVVAPTPPEPAQEPAKSPVVEPSVIEEQAAPPPPPRRPPAPRW